MSCSALVRGARPCELWDGIIVVLCGAAQLI
jgi:hypothetical protein